MGLAGGVFPFAIPCSVGLTYPIDFATWQFETNTASARKPSTLIVVDRARFIVYNEEAKRGEEDGLVEDNTPGNQLTPVTI
jgi:hypothetical protein